MMLALRRLTELGYERIGLHIPLQVNARAFRQWTGALLNYQMSLPVENRVEPLAAPVPSRKYLAPWLKKHRPDVIVTHLLEAQEALRELKVDVPGEVGLAILDLHPKDSRYAGLAGVDQDIESAGSAAVDMLIAQVFTNEYGPPTRPRITLTEGRWVQEGSVRQPDGFQRQACPVPGLHLFGT
jgi:DNA-binding LacI/PurR family transcriptional regulator